jgi:asparagine synthase (glutamine-hydrolysing)
MVADVPLGTFLSGGVDSSIISLLAKEHHKDLQTFSIGYKDEPLFDESRYAEKVAKHIGSKHHTFNLSNDVLLENMTEVLDYIDEPFADSSALAVYTLCKYTKDHVTVALSGDGSDEIFAGYNKHRAEWMVENGGVKKNIAQLGSFLWDKLPKSRNSKYGNIIRQLDRFAKMSKLSESERYMFLARFMNQKEAQKLIKGFDGDDGMGDWLDSVTKRKGMNGFLDKDLAMVLEGDMLVKVDRMSMVNSLEVRVPFLDQEFVEYGRALSVEHKIDAVYQKKILRDIYYKHLPSEVFDRKKHGFEVPLLKWFKNELYQDIDQKWLNEDMLIAQGILKVESIIKLKRKLNFVDSGDVAFDIWKLIVFQHWYKQYFEEN